jgi:probable HAF family extracellular repeat protein
MPFAAPAAPGYLAITPVAGKYAAAVGLNDAGHYAVNSFGPEIPIQPASIVKPPFSEDVGSLGGNITRIRALNNKDEAVGISVTADGVLHSFLYSSGPMQDLTAGYGIASVGAINDRGDITGQSQDLRAMVIRNGRAEIVGPANSAAGAINQAGDMLIEYFPAGQASRTCVYSGGTCADLPQFGGSYAVATAISDPGWVTGYGTITDGRPHAWLYDGNTMADLTPSAANAAAYDINDLGHVVGAMDNRAFLYADGKVIDLNTLLDPGADLLLTSAFAINDREQILATGCDRTGVFCYTTVLLDVIPAVPEPSGRTMWLSALSLLLVLRLACRKMTVCVHWMSGLRAIFKS